MPWKPTLYSLLVLASVGRAGDWPQWLGPTRDSVSPEIVKPWTSAPKVLWHAPAGEGNGTPVVAEGRVFVHAKVSGKNEEEVVAFDAQSGKELWRKTYERAPFKSLYGNGPRASPAVSGGNVYTFGITGVLICWEAATGKQLWQKDTLKELQGNNLFFGMACSPLVDEGKVFVNVGAKGASVVAFGANDGAVAWKALDDKASYSSPILFTFGAHKQLVFLTGAGVVSLDPSTGQLHWKFPLVDALFESSTTPARADSVLMASSITYGSVGLKLQDANGKPEFTKTWKEDGLTCYFSTPVAVGEQFYVVTGTKPPSRSNVATLHCIESKTGKELWSRPKVGRYHATLLKTGDGRLLMLEEAGNLVLVDPDPKEYRELARAKVCGDTWAHPALANGKLYVRDGKEVYCLQLVE